MDKKKFATGAKPPPECAWQMGKTLASTDFVREAELAIVQMQEQVKWMQEQINAIKAGSIVLYSHVNIELPKICNWREALIKPTSIELACDSFAMNYVDTHEVWGCGVGSANGEFVIHAYVTDISKVNLPSEYNGFKVIVVESGKPVPHQST